MDRLSPTEMSDSIFFQPDTLLPMEFYDTVQKKRRPEPECRLMRAVLEDAISCFQKYLCAQGKSGKKLFREAEEWILEKNSEWIFSFKNVCEVLGFNPEYVRRGLLHWKEEKMARSRKADVLSSHPRGVSSEVRDRHRFYRLVG